MVIKYHVSPDDIMIREQKKKSGKIQILRVSIKQVGIKMSMGETTVMKINQKWKGVADI